jgi:hypothetical protein
MDAQRSPVGLPKGYGTRLKCRRYQHANAAASPYQARCENVAPLKSFIEQPAANWSTMRSQRFKGAPGALMILVTPIRSIESKGFSP